jgi:teichuronic acid exporter
LINSTLKQKTIKGISWSLIDRFGNQFIKVIIYVILARLLTPEDFGLIGIMMVTLVFAQVFITGGFGEAFIQKKEVTDLDACTVFYTNIFVSIIIYGILWITSPFIAKFYSQPELLILIRVMGLIIIINACNVIQIAQLTRAVNFRRHAKINLIAALLSGLSGISAAYYGLGVWSLVILQIINCSLVTLGLWVTSKWKLTAQFSIESFRGLFSFGMWVLSSKMIVAILDNIYILTIGKFFPVIQLGYYTQARRFQEISSKQIAGAISVVSFSVFSKLQKDLPQLKKSVRKILTNTMIFMLPLMLIIILIAKPLVILLLTSKWLPMVPYLQLLCIVGILSPMHSVNVQIIISQGMSRLNFYISSVKMIMRILNIFITFRWGISYIIIGEIIISTIGLFIDTYYSKKVINYGLIEQLYDIRYIVIHGLIGLSMAYLICLLIENQLLFIISNMAIVIVVYILLHYIYNRDSLIELKNSFNLIKYK